MAGAEGSREAIGRVVAVNPSQKCLACSGQVMQGKYGLSICEDCAKRFEWMFAEDPIWKQQVILNEFGRLLREFLATADRMTRLIGGSAEEFQEARRQCKAIAERLRSFHMSQNRVEN